MYTKIITILAFVCCAVFIFLVPFDWQSANYILGSFALFVVINPNLYRNFKTYKMPLGEKSLLLLMAVFLLIELLSFIWSDNINRALKVLTRHLPLFAMPCLMVLSKIGGIIKRPQIILNIFCLGVIVSMLMCLILSFFDSMQEIDGVMVFEHRLPDYLHHSTFSAISCGYSYFSYSQLSHFTNPHYFALYINMLIMLAYFKFYECKRRVLPIVLLCALILFCMAFIFMLCNRANFFIFFVMVVIIAIYEFFIKKHKIVGVVALVALVSLVVAVFSTGRGQDLVFKLRRALINKQDYTNINEVSEEQLELIGTRTITWNSALHLIKKHPILGCGIGDNEESLVEQFIIDGYLHAAERRFNCHNQYLDEWISCGILGLLALIGFVILPAVFGFKYKNLALVIYSLALAVGFCTEVMFTRSAGCFSVTLLMMLFIMIAYDKYKNIGELEKSNYQTPVNCI